MKYNHLTQKRSAVTRLIVAHVVWVDRYQGDTATVRNVGHRFEQADHIDENSGEVFNFSPIDGRCIGYVPRFTQHTTKAPKRFKTMNIDRLGASPLDNFLNGVTVVWTATPGQGKQRVIVGWYENATANRIATTGLDPSRPDESFYFSAPADHCFLIPAELRDFEIQHARKASDGDGPGNDAFYYPGERVKKEIIQYLKIAPSQVISKTQSNNIEQSNARRAGSFNKGPRQPDTQMRLAVEEAAMKAVTHALRAGDWSVEDVSALNMGWDISAAKQQGTRHLRVEVKGLSGSVATIQLTPNEYAKLRNDIEDAEQDRYVIAIVTNALSEDPTLQAFSCAEGVWLPFDIEKGHHKKEALCSLTVTTVESAICSVVEKRPR